MKTDTLLAHWPFSAVSGIVLSIKYQAVKSVENTAQTFDYSMFVAGV
jgi:hypothetical protein